MAFLPTLLICMYDLDDVYFTKCFLHTYKIVISIFFKFKVQNFAQQGVSVKGSRLYSTLNQNASLEGYHE